MSTRSPRQMPGAFLFALESARNQKVPCPPLTLEDVFGEEGRHGDVRQVNNVANF